jgi:hypothetical protein
MGFGMILDQNKGHFLRHKKTILLRVLGNPNPPHIVSEKINIINNHLRLFTYAGAE